MIEHVSGAGCIIERPVSKFTVFNQAVIECDELQLIDKFVYIYLSSKMDGWVFHTSEIRLHCAGNGKDGHIGLDAVQESISRLREFGLIYTKRMKTGFVKFKILMTCERLDKWEKSQLEEHIANNTHKGLHPVCPHRATPGVYTTSVKTTHTYEESKSTPKPLEGASDQISDCSKKSSPRRPLTKKDKQRLRGSCSGASAETVYCPVCHAGPGEHCRSKAGAENLDPHSARRETYLRSK